LTLERIYIYIRGTNIQQLEVNESLNEIVIMMQQLEKEFKWCRYRLLWLCPKCCIEFAKEKHNQPISDIEYLEEGSDVILLVVMVLFNVKLKELSLTLRKFIS